MTNIFQPGDSIKVAAYRATLAATVNAVEGQWVRFTITSVPYCANGASDYKAGYRRTVDYRQCAKVDG